MSVARSLVNLFWLTAIIVAAAFDRQAWLLAIIAIFVADGVLDLKAIRAYAKGLRDVFDPDAVEISAEHAETMTANILERVRAETHAAAKRRLD